LQGWNHFVAILGDGFLGVKILASQPEIHCARIPGTGSPGNFEAGALPAALANHPTHVA